MKPVIGICMAEAPSTIADKLILNTAYVRAIIDAGATPLVIPVDSDAGRAAEYIGFIDGLLLPGGEDVSPFLYGQDPAPQVSYIQEYHDRMELEMIRLAAEKGIPVLGICRGLQLMNIAFGGTLIQDLPSQKRTDICHKQHSAIRSQATHSAKVVEGSLMEALLGKEPLFVNSYHHQAVDKVAEGFAVTVRAADGVVEAIEDTERKMFAVQWHPEEMYIRYPHFANLFRHLAETAAATK